MLNKLLAKEKLAEFLKEDLGFGDLSTAYLPDGETAGSFIAKEDGIACGQEIPGMVYELLGGDAVYSPCVKDGDFIKKGTVMGKSCRKRQDSFSW